MAKTGPTTHRSGVVRPAIVQIRQTFAYVDRQRRLLAVIDADDLETAWRIATDHGNAADIEYAKGKGRKVVPCIVEWQE